MRDFANSAEKMERERIANQRLAEIRIKHAEKLAAQKEANERRLKELGRPEYLFAKNAERKEAQYQKWRENRARERAEMESKREIRRQARLAQGRSPY